MTKPGPRNRHRRQPRADRRSADGHGAGMIWGRHAVDAALANPNRRIRRLIATANAMDRIAAAQRPERADTVLPAELDRLLPPGAVHQGVAIEADPLEPLALEEVIARPGVRLAVLDQVSDPHNLGAIWRSAAAFGVDALVLQTRKTPEVTGVVAKSAAGAVDQVAEVRVVNISRALDQMSEAGIVSIGLAGEAEAELEQVVSGVHGMALVLGAEGAGLRPLVRRHCTYIARIPMAPGMESLNVSNAAAIAFHEMYRALRASSS